MHTGLQTYSRATLLLWPVVVAALLLVAGSAAAQDLSEFTQPIQTVLSLVSNVIGPAIGIGGLIYAGAMFFYGETGRPFKIALCVVVGGVLISSAESIWTNLFGGVGVGG